MPDDKQYRSARRARLAGRVIGLVAAGFSLVFLVASAISGTITEDSTGDLAAGVLLAVLVAIALAGCILSWWRERPAACCFTPGGWRGRRVKYTICDL